MFDREESVNRRALLSLCTTATCSGCLGAARRRAPRLAWIWLANDRDEAYEVEVAVEEGGETVFAETRRVGTEPDTASVRIDNPVDGPGQYAVRARADGAVREIDSTDVVDGDENCVGVRFSLLDDGDMDYWTKSMRKC